VIDNPQVREISDHNPIVVDFDFLKRSIWEFGNLLPVKLFREFLIDYSSFKRFR
jgi:hypothetical protein